MPRTLQELHDEMGTLMTRATEVMDALPENASEDEIRTAETTFDEIMIEHDGVEADYRRQERLANAQARAEQRQEDEERRARDRRPGGAGGVDPDERNDGEPTYADVFRRYLSVGVAEMTSEERQILQRGSIKLPGSQNADAETRALTTGTGSSGGFTVPEETAAELERTMLDWGPMYDGNIVRELNTSTGVNIDWPTIDDTANSGRIKAENAAVDDDGTDDPVFGEKDLDAYVYDTGMVKIPLELLQDSIFDMEPLISDLFGERMGRVANNVLTLGDGSSKPQGVVPAASVGKTAASATAITGDEILDFHHSLNAAYRRSPNARYMFADTTLLAIRKLKDGDGNYLWQMGDVRSGEPSTLNGKPYSINDDMADIATGVRSMLFGDFSKYIVRKVIGFQTLTLRERYAEFFQVGMVGYKRFDGELMNAAAMKAFVQA